MERPKTVVFQGVTYELLGSYYLSQATRRADRKGAKGLHVAVWEHHHGTLVPEGCQVHHIDGDTTHNAIDNLECLTPKEHAQRHRQPCSDRQRQHLQEVRSRASEWHRSPEGRAWHREHGREVWEDHPTYPRVCATCGQSFEAQQEWARFCSDTCSRKHRIKAGRYDETGRCQVCGNEFRWKKLAKTYTPPATCSRSCAAKRTWETRRSSLMR